MTAPDRSPRRRLGPRLSRVAAIARLADRPGALVGGLVLSIAVAWLVFSLFTGFVFEDAYITFRYARNLAGGLGFTYNPGDRVLGTTTPLFTLILAAWTLLFGSGSMPAAASILGIGAMAGCLLLLDRQAAALGLGTLPRVVAVVLIGAHPDVLWAAAGGMETPLVLCAMALAGFGFAARRPSLLAVGMAALVLLRPDGALWAAALVLGLAVGRRWRELLTAGALAGGLVLPWVVFATVYFGNPLPHSVYAKRAIAKVISGDQAIHPALSRIEWFLEKLGVVDGLIYERPFLLVVSALALLGAIEASRRLGADAFPYVTFPVLFVTAFTAGLAPTTFPWYVLPLYWGLAPLGGFGASRIERWVRHAPAGPARRLAPVLAVATVALASLGATWVAHFVWFERSGEEQKFLRDIGEWVRRATPEESTVALEPIGYIGYFSEREIVDLAGLVSPEVVEIARRTDSNASTFAALLARRRPDYLILRAEEVDENRHFYGGPLFASPSQRRAFERAYREVGRFEADGASTLGELGRLMVYCRRGSACEAMRPVEGMELR